MARGRLGKEIQARRLGRELSTPATGPRIVSLPASGRETTGIEWGAGAVAILFLHDPADPSAADSWGHWPDRFHDRGYRTLALDLPDDDPAALGSIATVAMRHLTASGSGTIMVVAAGNACAIRGEDLPQGLVWIAPPPDLHSPAISSVVPKLIISGSASPEDRAALKRLASSCRGWTLLSTFAVLNEAALLLESAHADQIESQIATFLHEVRTTRSLLDSRIGKRNPRLSPQRRSPNRFSGSANGDPSRE